MSNYLLTNVIAAAVQISRRAARIIRDIKISGSLDTKEKAKNDYVTKADFQSQMCIIRSLEKMFPKLVFCGEEGVCCFFFGILFLNHLKSIKS
jgi:3'-phosphoadenosine 5'-phosphosulfate (PAPS) 3'-phosphatase